ncbi:Tn3 family transposase [Streptomyces sp. SID4919]|nr:Tn3 family transposase [Streptomyces sp. SID4919]MYY11961.1 Tn3 family transposase [Streptomyces sp. SID4919]SCK13536.1 Transposase and inactivated derivatives, TnpA family [Streptomyces sp. AmelKG-E11A]
MSRWSARRVRRLVHNLLLHAAQAAAFRVAEERHLRGLPRGRPRIRTVQLLRHLSDEPPRRRVTAATNKMESFNRFSQWVGFGNCGVIADNDPVEQDKAMKFNALLTNAVIFHNALDIAEIVRRLLEEGCEIDPEDPAHISPY